ncbi:MAG TPA: FKBP-type peptidyl-prolyl cis-trans isomerase [Rhodanobacteraceae bacterium]|jgi:FKBP-type peptidyl-prolyl cis-trans isomerase|nr:FKBP-type peptidyl-prolyl cis-trans isomerase [Rhodanobacteraceae bacterium]
MASFVLQKTERADAPAYHHQRISQMKQIMRPTLAAVAVIAALGIASISQAQTSTASTHVDKTKASEIVGYRLAEAYPDWARSLISPDAVGRAVTRALQGQKPSMSETEAESVAKAFTAEFQTLGKQHYDQVSAANKRAGDAYLAQNKNKPGVRVTQDGLQYQVISQGTGPRPTANDTVEIQYTGSLTNGQVFDASARHQGPTKFSLSNIIPGMKEALLLMPVGSHYKFVIPSDLAYGANPDPRLGMAPNETLIFDVTLVKIDNSGAAAK